VINNRSDKRLNNSANDNTISYYRVKRQIQNKNKKIYINNLFVYLYILYEVFSKSIKPYHFIRKLLGTERYDLAVFILK